MEFGGRWMPVALLTRLPVRVALDSGSCESPDIFWDTNALIDYQAWVWPRLEVPFDGYHELTAPAS